MTGECDVLSFNKELQPVTLQGSRTEKENCLLEKTQNELTTLFLILIDERGIIHIGLKVKFR